MYKTVIIKYSPKAKEMALKIEETANQMEHDGFELITCSIMPSEKVSWYLENKMKPCRKSSNKKLL